MSSRVIRFSAGILSLFLLIYVGFQIFSFSRDQYVTQTAYAQNVAQTISVEGIFFREETVIPMNSSGVVSSYYKVGTKVAVRTPLGCVYPDAAAVRDQYRLDELENTRDALKKAENAASVSEVVKPELLNGQAAQYISRMIAARDSGDLSGLSGVKSGLLEVLARRNLVLSGAENYAERISELDAQAAALKSQASGEAQEFLSTASGYYVDHVDGWEQTLTADYLAEMKAPDVERFVASYTGYHADQSAVKVVSNHEWQFVISLSEQELQSLAGSRTVLLQFPNHREKVKMTVQSSDRDPDSGRYKVCLKGDTVDPFLLGTRVQSAEILVTTFSGLKIPKEALRFPEKEMGVYILLGDKVYFRKIEQIYETTDYVLSRIYYQGDPEGADFVKLYDTIIVKGKDLYDQKLLP